MKLGKTLLNGNVKKKKERDYFTSLNCAIEENVYETQHFNMFI